MKNKYLPIFPHSTAANVEELEFFVFFLFGPCSSLTLKPERKVTAQSADWSLISEMLKHLQHLFLSVCLHPGTLWLPVTFSGVHNPLLVLHSIPPLALSFQSDGTRVVPSLHPSSPTAFPGGRRDTADPWISSLEPGSPSPAFLCLLVSETLHILPHEHAAFLTHHHPPLNLLTQTLLQRITDREDERRKLKRVSLCPQMCPLCPSHPSWLALSVSLMQLALRRESGWDGNVWR